jgi:hypothetical protein
MTATVSPARDAARLPDGREFGGGDNKEIEMPIAYFCFITGAIAGLTGMSLGIYMGMAQDFSLTPVHAHLNLLGWVTMVLYGLYYRGLRSSTRLAWIQVIAAALGFPMMTGGLALMLTHAPQPDDPFWRGLGEPATILGSLLTIGSMALFMAVLVRDAFVSRIAQRTPTPAVRS